MGRKSKLNDKQWQDIERRMLEGEPVRFLAREYGIAEASIRGRKSAQVEGIKTVANQIVATERAVMALPIAAQITAHNYAAKLRALSDNVLDGASMGAATFHRLTALANSEVAKIDDAEPLANIEALKGVAALTKVANDAVAPALNLIAANKDRMREAESQPEEASIDATKLSDGTLQELLAARA